MTTPQFAPSECVDDCNPFEGQGVVSFSGRNVNPLVEGSSPSPVISDRTRQKPPRIVIPKGLGQVAIPSQSRQQATADAPFRPLTATETATRLLPAEADLATVIDAWDCLPDAVRAGIVAMVKAASKASSRLNG